MSEVNFTFDTFSKRNKKQYIRSTGVLLAHLVSSPTFKMMVVDAKKEVDPMCVEVPKVDAMKVVDAIDDVTGAVTDLLETVAKIGCFFGAADNSCGDRAKDISEIIAWAKEFQSINAGRVWDGEWEDELRVFFKSKVSPEIDDDFLVNF